MKAVFLQVPWHKQKVRKKTRDVILMTSLLIIFHF